MGFSIIGLITAASIFLPNLIFIMVPPRNVPENLKDAGLLFTLSERAGQAGCLIVPVLSRDNYQNAGIDVWFVLMALCIIFYYGLWGKYILKGHAFSLAFVPLGFIPVPMAVFPVLAFGFAALWGQSVILGIAVIFLAVGHLANSWHTYKSIK